MKRIELLNFRIGIEEDGVLTCDAVEAPLFDMILKDLNTTEEQKEKLDKEVKNTYNALYKIGELLDSIITSDEELESEEV